MPEVWPFHRGSAVIAVGPRLCGWWAVPGGDRSVSKPSPGGIAQIAQPQGVLRCVRTNSALRATPGGSSESCRPRLRRVADPRRTGCRRCERLQPTWIICRLQRGPTHGRRDLLRGTETRAALIRESGWWSNCRQTRAAWRRRILPPVCSRSHRGQRRHRPGHVRAHRGIPAPTPHRVPLPAGRGIPTRMSIGLPRHSPPRRRRRVLPPHRTPLLRNPDCAVRWRPPLLVSSKNAHFGCT